VGLLKRVFAVVAILGTTFVGMREIAKARNEGEAGGAVYVLDPASGPAWAAWQHLLTHLQEVDARELRARLEKLQAEQRIWIAPRLGSGQRALWISTLGLVERVYVAERELTRPPAELYPNLHVPPLHLETFRWISLAGTLLHELSHARGVLTEANAYQLEIEWLQSLANRPTSWPPGSPQREAWDWAVKTAIANAERAKAISGS
jgi:hypothetical protein